MKKNQMKNDLFIYNTNSQSNTFILRKIIPNF